jgi:hypothetical protein
MKRRSGLSAVERPKAKRGKRGFAAAGRVRFRGWLAGAHGRIPVGLILDDEAASTPCKQLAQSGRRITCPWHETSY